MVVDSEAGGEGGAEGVVGVGVEFVRDVIVKCLRRKAESLVEIFVEEAHGESVEN
jgi:hypothetical protein